MTDYTVTLLDLSRQNLTVLPDLFLEDYETNKMIHDPIISLPLESITTNFYYNKNKDGELMI